MRISDWSSDVCSADLLALPRSLSSFRAPPFIAVSSINPFLVLLSGRCFGRASGNFLFPRPISISLRNERIEHGRVRAAIVHHPSPPSVGLCFDLSDPTRQIGSESCRDRVCQYVLIW